MKTEPKAVARGDSRSRAWGRFATQRVAVCGAWVLAVCMTILLLWPWVQRFDPSTIGERQFSAPDAEHWLGTDVHGRDMLSRVMHGARMSMLVGLAGAGVSLVIGVFWGAVAGYVGGRLDAVMMRLVDILYSLPSIIFVIVLITTLEGMVKRWMSGFVSSEFASITRVTLLFVGLGGVSWLTMARIVRGQVLALRDRPFVVASRALGAGQVHILRRHILPNIFGVVLVYATLTVPAVVLYESFLSFLGLGIQPPQASLGSLIAEGASQINSVRIYWWLIAYPSAVLAGLLMTLSFLGDGLRDALEVRGES